MSTTEASVSIAEFEEIFESVKNWGRWGADDQLGTLNFITPEKVCEAAALVRSGRRVSMAIPINKVSGPDNPSQATLLVVQGHDVPWIRARSGSDLIGWGWRRMATATRMWTRSATSRITVSPITGGRLTRCCAQMAQPSRTLPSTTKASSDGACSSISRSTATSRGWSQGEVVRRAELEECAAREAVEIGEGDILVFRTGHHRRRLELGPWDNSPPPGGEGKAGLHVDTIPWMHERRLAAFLPDGDGEAIPSVIDGITYPIHPLQVAAMGMLVSDSLQFEELVAACEEEHRYEFMVVGLPLRLPGGTGSPWNPIAIL